MANHCREQPTDEVLNISVTKGRVQELVPHYQDVNGSMLWELTSVSRFVSPDPHASNVHGSHFSHAGHEQIALPTGHDALVGTPAVTQSSQSDFQPSRHGYRADDDDRRMMAAAQGGMPAAGSDHVAMVMVRPCMSLSVQTSNRTRG